MKTCSKCKLEKPFTDFYFRKTEKRYQAYCKICLCETQIKRWISLKQEMMIYKGGKCLDCSYIGPYQVFDFHHRDPSQKDMDWNKARTSDRETMIKEVDKCDLLCSNCH